MELSWLERSLAAFILFYLGFGFVAFAGVRLPATARHPHEYVLLAFGAIALGALWVERLAADESAKVAAAFVQGSLAMCSGVVATDLYVVKCEEQWAAEAAKARPHRADKFSDLIE